MPNLEISGASREQDEANAKKIENYIKEIKNNSGTSGENIFAYQAGTGLLGFESQRVIQMVLKA